MHFFYFFLEANLRSWDTNAPSLAERPRQLWLWAGWVWSQGWWWEWVSPQQKLGVFSNAMVHGHWFVPNNKPFFAWFGLFSATSVLLLSHPNDSVRTNCTLVSHSLFILSMYVVQMILNYWAPLFASAIFVQGSVRSMLAESSKRPANSSITESLPV